MAESKEKTGFDIYEALDKLLNEIKDKLPNYRCYIQPQENSNNYILHIDHQDGHIVDCTIYNHSSYGTLERWVEQQLKQIVKTNKNYELKKRHINNGLSPAEFTPDTAKRIQTLARKVYGHKYPVIVIEETAYSNSLFRNWIVKFARTQGQMRNKSEPLLYIDLHEFFTSILFDEIFSVTDLANEPDPELANEWSEINETLMKIIFIL